MLAQTAVGVDWLSLLQTFGLAVTILFSVGIALYKGCGWAGREVIIPLRDRGLARFVAFLDKIQETVSKIDSNMDRMIANLDKQTLVLADLEQSSISHKMEILRLDVANTEKLTKLDTLLIGQTEVMAELKKTQELMAKRS